MLNRFFIRRGGKRKDQLNQRCRTAVIWGVVSVVAFQAGFYPVSDLWPQLQDGEYGHKLANLRSQLAAKPADKPLVVMFGSSLTGCGFDPEAMTTLQPGSPAGPVVYNFGINSAGPVVHLLCLRRLLAEGIRPDLVLLETEPRFLLYPYNTVGSEHYLQIPRLQYRDLSVLNRYDPKAHELRQEWRSRAWLPWYYHRLDLQNSFLQRWVPKDQRFAVWDYTDRYGWEGKMNCLLNPHPPLTVEQLKMIGNHHQHEIDVYPIFDVVPQVYREMVKTCQQAGIPVMFVRMPQQTYYMRNAPPALNDRIEGFYAEVTRDTGVQFIDARTWVDDSGFDDGTHLLPDGAAAFSQRLERECLEPFVTRFAEARRPPQRVASSQP